MVRLPHTPAEVERGQRLGALLRGHGYVPLNPAFPTDRTRTMVARSGCRCLIVDRHGAEQLRDVLTLQDVVFLDLDEACGCITAGISQPTAATAVASFATSPALPLRPKRPAFFCGRAHSGTTPPGHSSLWLG